MPNISLPSDQELDAATLQYMRQLPNLNIVKMIARTGLIKEIYSVVGTMFSNNWFPATDREVMMFRICQQNNSNYELKQHLAFAVLEPKVTDAILSNNLNSPALSAWQKTLCQLCDELTKQAKLSKQSVQLLVDHYGSENVATRAIFVMSWINMLNRFVDSTDVPLETGSDPYKGIHSAIDKD